MAGPAGAFFPIRQWLRGRASRVRAAAVLFALIGAARADVVLAPLFSDGAVLQCDKLVPVWGTAKPGEPVAVSFAGQLHAAVAGPDGRWVVLLDPLPASDQGRELVVAGAGNTVDIHDVVVGEVWLCSGQSNMSFPVSQAANAAAEIAAARFPLLRQVQIAQQVAETPADRVATSGWKPATPDNVGHFTAVGYFFARELHEKLGVPVGIVNSSWGGTPIEAWLSPMAVASDPAFAVIAERWHQVVAQFPAEQAQFETRLAAWTQQEPAAKARGEKAYLTWVQHNPKPQPPSGPGSRATPTGLFNGMINPLVPYALRGVVWYQGESNAIHAAEYHALFAALITSWRAHFGQGELPFYWVNLPNYRADAGGLSWAMLREAQTKTLSLPNTGQAIAIDLGETANLHPANKQEVGRRLALLAKHRVYDVVVDDTGPTFVQAVREGTAMRVRFAHAHSGLIAHEKPPQALELAGADRVFRPAVGRIERDTLVVTSPVVKDPVAVRYAWHNAPDANLYNGEGLPAVPFRSDDW